jgi:hypothetical protein
VYEYVDNGNLDQWLQGDVGNVSPLTWDIRMNIILGTAKGYGDVLKLVQHYFVSIQCMQLNSSGDFLLLQIGLSSRGSRTKGRPSRCKI